jgi:hypothetical protein
MYLILLYNFVLKIEIWFFTIYIGNCSEAKREVISIKVKSPSGIFT